MTGNLFDGAGLGFYHIELILEFLQNLFNFIGKLCHFIGGIYHIRQLFGAGLGVGNGFFYQSNHFLNHGSNVFYLGTDLSGHLQRGKCFFLKNYIVLGKLRHVINNHIGAVFIFVGKLADNGNAVNDGVAGTLYLLDGLYHTGEVCFDGI